jgi:hypothetical protein
VERIVCEHRHGASLRAIAAALDADQMPTARSTRWHTGAFALCSTAQEAAKLS